MKRNLVLFIGILITLALAIPVQAAQSPQTPLAPNPLTWKFQQPLPLLSAAGGSINTIAGNTSLAIHMCEFKSNVLPPGAISGYTGTWVWGYLNDPNPDGSSSCASLVDLYDNGVVDGTSGPLNTYTGPVILNQRGIPTQITWINNLGSTADTNVLAYKFSTDQTLHWADPAGGGENMCAHMTGAPAFGSDCAQNYEGSIPATPHLHGGEVPAQIDGGPNTWFTSDGTMHGSNYYTKNPGADAANSVVYTYPNSQEGAPTWFHDHTMGATRLNVYMGLAGGYYQYDPNQILPLGLDHLGLSRHGNVGTDELLVPIVIQDRMFDSNGQLYFPAATNGGVVNALNPEHPYWVPEFIGDTILVNGKAWPFFNVEPKRYRFLFLEGSNARPYDLQLNYDNGAAGPSIYVIGTDGGYLDKPVKVNHLVMLPGERYEVIIDFSFIQPGKKLTLMNSANAPYPDGDPVTPGTTDQVMQFHVIGCASKNCGLRDLSYNPALGIPIRWDGQKIVRLPGTIGGPAIVTKPGKYQNVQKIRTLTLNEIAFDDPRDAIDPVTGNMVSYPGGPVEILVNNTKFAGDRITGVDSGGMFTMEPVPGFTPVSVGGDTIYMSELPVEGDTEIWEIVNTTMDAHPIHTHLVQFQLLDRQPYNTDAYNAAYGAAFPGGGWDRFNNVAYPAGVFIPAFGPPLAIDGSDPRSGGKLGGNLDPFAKDPSTHAYLYMQGSPAPANAWERGWKDTVIAMPGQVTRFVVRWAPDSLPLQTGKSGTLNTLYFPFDPTDPRGYVWHCHIVDHEDNEMMRPDILLVNPALPPGARTFIQGEDY